MRKYPCKEPVLVTCGLPYASGPMHVGHLRTYVPADVFVRFLRKLGVNVTFVCGSDTHGTPVMTAAEKVGLTPKELATKYHQQYLGVFPRLSIFFDNFGTTDDPENHHRTTQIVTTLMKNGYVYSRDLQTPYCDREKRSLPDRYVRGECPYCHKDARGDECDQGCGRYLEPGEILNPRCAICGSPTRPITRKHYYFRLTDFADFLQKYVEAMDGTKNAKGYALGWLREGLKDWCITRDIDWGVRFPGDPSLVLYVWVDAPIGYIASTEQWAKKIGKPDAWERYWKPGDGRIVHFIGQDIVYHHCIFWPAMLKGSGYNLPDAVVASGMVKVDGNKLSRSRGYVIWLLDDYLDQNLDPDYMRYYVVSYTSQTKDLDFTWDSFNDKVNNELVNTLGNFFYRAMYFSNQHFGGVPQGNLPDDVRQKIQKTMDAVVEGLNEYELKKVVDEIMALASYGNEYFQSNKPWELVKRDKAKCQEVLYNSLALTKALAVLIEPIMPSVAEKVWRQLGIDSDVHKVLLSEALSPPKQGSKLGEVSPIITKIDEKLLARLKDLVAKRIQAALAADHVEPEKMISIEEFHKMDIRAGKIVECTAIPKMKKLLLLKVDIGKEVRTIVTGLADQYKPEQLTGLTALFLANLESKKIGGFESHGMILAVEKADEPGKWIPVTVTGVPPGSKVA